MLDSPLDRARTVALVKQINTIVKDHLTGLPQGPFRPLEALNAMAIVAAALLAGCDQEPKAIAFFKLALQEALNDIVAQDRITVTVGGNNTEH